MLYILTRILDLVAPPHNSVRLIRAHQPTNSLPYFSPTKVANTTALSPFHVPLIQAAIVANKFYNYEPAAALLAQLLDRWLDTLPDHTPTYLVPIPLSPHRQKERGYNQVERIIRASAHSKKLTLNLLYRTRETAPQTKLDRQARIKNLAGAFAIDWTQLPSSGRIVLVDDVITTGATLHAATSAFKQPRPKNLELLTIAIAH